jgi:Tol biopolymer transport system component
MDWLPDTNQMLVLTWDKDLDLYENAPVTTQLQMWDIAANTLTALIPGGRDGRFSPDGVYLAYLVRNENGFDIQLLSRADNRVIFTTPQHPNENNEFVNPNFSFSPDGRFVTFYVRDAGSPDGSFLQVFNVSSQQVIAELPATPYWEFTWSPNSEYFLYENEHGGLALFNLKDSSTFLLTENNDTRLSNPQWSFDGSYLSVTVREGDVVKTAVLAIP